MVRPLMITPRYCQVMARYNRWQNKNAVAAADTLSDGLRAAGRGAFFGSVINTLRHTLWGDHIWMSRFDGWDAQDATIADSIEFGGEWPEYKTKRTITDARIIRWADHLSDGDLEGDLSWYSGALQREVTKPAAICIMHLFNHQTHHRGQVHAMLTASGARPGDTDLFIMPEER